MLQDGGGIMGQARQKNSNNDACTATYTAAYFQIFRRACRILLWQHTAKNNDSVLEKQFFLQARQRISNGDAYSTPVIWFWHMDIAYRHPHTCPWMCMFVCLYSDMDMDIHACVCMYV